MEWEVIDINVFDPGRLFRQNVLCETVVRTPYAKREICDDIVSSARLLLIDEPILRHIEKCTEIVTHRQLQDNAWAITLEELDSFIAVLYAHGDLPVYHLLSILWGLEYFTNLCEEIIFKKHEFYKV